MDQVSVRKTIIELVNRYIHLIRENNFRVKEVYLFGSYAKNSFNDDSDIDLAIVLEHPVDEFEEQMKLMRLTRFVDSRIEPHPCDEADFNDENPFAYEILKSGVKIL